MSEQVEPQGALTDRPERHPSWLELFFDLVFVAAVAALTHQLHADHSLAGLAVFAGLFVPVWWAWRGFAWYATGFDTDDRTFRCALFSGMLGVGALSAGVHGAVTRHLDGVAIMRLTVAGMVLAAALAGLGLGPLAFVALVTVLLIAEATIEMTRAPPAAGREDDGQSPGCGR